MIGANTNKIETRVTVTGMMMGICKIQRIKSLLHSLAILIEVACMKEYFDCLMHFFTSKFSGIRWGNWRSSRIWIGKTLVPNYSLRSLCLYFKLQCTSLHFNKFGTWLTCNDLGSYFGYSFSGSLLTALTHLWKFGLCPVICASENQHSVIFSQSLWASAELLLNG